MVFLYLSVTKSANTFAYILTNISSIFSNNSNCHILYIGFQYVIVLISEGTALLTNFFIKRTILFTIIAFCLIKYTFCFFPLSPFLLSCYEKNQNTFVPFVMQHHFFNSFTYNCSFCSYLCVSLGKSSKQLNLS